MEYRICEYGDSNLAHYTALFAQCFPSARKLSNLDYLRWLYLENPEGHAVGYDAWHGEQLAGHYVCVPARMTYEGVEVRALLSLNTATHPSFQGKGIFTTLADMTYARAQQLGYAMVYGVANSNSTPGFVRKLGFNLVGKLESRIGAGRLGDFDWNRISDCSRMRHAWTSESIDWRCRNPFGPVTAWMRGDVMCLSAPTGKPGLNAWAEMPSFRADNQHRVGFPFGLRLWLGLIPGGAGRFGAYFHLPDRFRPSPLNLIVRQIQSSSAPRQNEVLFNFLDFDAF